MRTRRPSTDAPAARNSSSAGSWRTSTPVSASSSSVASCRRRHSASPQTVSLASGMPIPPTVSREQTALAPLTPHGFPDFDVKLIHARNGMSSTYTVECMIHKFA